MKNLLNPVNLFNLRFRHLTEEEIKVVEELI